MDCFDSHYYHLNRKLLALVGQWPYQDLATKVTRRILYLFFLGLSSLPQSAILLTEELDFNIWIEVICSQVTGLLAVTRTFLFAFNNVEVIELLEIMKFNWRSLADKEEFEIFEEAAEEGRLNTLHYIILSTLASMSNVIFSVLQPLIKNGSIMNESSSRGFLYSAVYFVDEEKYYYLILTHMITVMVILMMGAIAGDTMFLVFLYHTMGMFKIVCHQLEHVFDNCSNKTKAAPSRTIVCQRIAAAVEWHRRAIRFNDGIVTATQWLNFFGVIVFIVNMSLVLYWIVMSNGQGLGPLVGLTMFLYSFFLNHPAQKMTDSSMQIAYKAYCSSWYKAPTKQQILLLFPMQQGLRPCYQLMGKIHPMTLENYSVVIKTTFSSFTALLSLK